MEWREIMIMPVPIPFRRRQLWERISNEQSLFLIKGKDRSRSAMQRRNRFSVVLVDRRMLQRWYAGCALITNGVNGIVPIFTSTIFYVFMIH